MRLLELLPLAGLALAVASAQTDERLKQAGVCARCHVISVVEWSMSGHPKAGTDCVACHLTSKGHVADERNNVKPERLPRGEQIAALCATCHAAGCPKAKAAAGCQSCHHVHALVDPRKAPSTKDGVLEQLTIASAEVTNKIASGDRYAAQGKWADAKSEYGAALALSPRSIAARVRLSVAANNLRNDWPGFEFDTHAARDASGLPKQVKVEGYPIEMVLVAGGDAEIGSERFASSKPIHTVVIESFYLARTEVTQALWRTVMGSNPSAHQGGKFPDADRLPVEQVSWRDAQTFIDKLNRAVPGSGFRLPTEVEWEFAARHAGGTPPEVPLSSPRAVGSSSPNQLGLYDMQGNVAEWCSSLAAPYPYDSGDGRERADAEGLRVLRGGAYNDTQDLLDPSLRHSERPDRRLKFNGFRLARSIRPPERSYACRTCEPASTARQ